MIKTYFRIISRYNRCSTGGYVISPIYIGILCSQICFAGWWREEISILWVTFYTSWEIISFFDILHHWESIIGGYINVATFWGHTFYTSCFHKSASFRYASSRIGCKLKEITPEIPSHNHIGLLSIILLNKKWRIWL